MRGSGGSREAVSTVTLGPAPGKLHRLGVLKIQDRITISYKKYCNRDTDLKYFRVKVGLSTSLVSVLLGKALIKDLGQMEPVSRVSKICGDMGILGSGTALCLQEPQGLRFH